MKTINRMISISMFALTAGISCEAGKPQLKLRGKTITIYPVLLRQLDQEESVAQVWRHGPGIAENLGVSLEKWGMLPRVSATEFPVGIVWEDLTESVKKPSALSDKPLATNYALILLFEVKKAEGKPLVRAQAVMTDSSGRAVWVQRQSGFSTAGNMWPLALTHQITESLLPVSDLKKPETEPDPGPFKTQLRKKYEARSKEDEKLFREKLMIRRLTGKAQEQTKQKEPAKEGEPYKPDPRHVGRYTDQKDPSCYLELKPDGSVHFKVGRYEIEGTFTVDKDNTLVLTLPEHGSRPAGRIEANKFISNVGNVLIKQ